jgi:hypothetical protein
MYQGNTLLSSTHDERILVWDLHHRTLERELPLPVKDSGGISMALSPDETCVYAGTYYSGGCFGFCRADGRLLWRRADLKRFYGIACDSLTGRLFCYFDGRSCEELDPGTGKTVAKHRGVKEVYCSSFSQHRLFATRVLELHGTQGFKWSVPRESFAVLSTAFSPLWLTVTEPNATVRCFDLESGRCAWRYVPPEGHHVIELGYIDSESMFVGVEWAYKKGGDMFLVHWSESGNFESRFPISGAAAHIFCASGTMLVDNEGVVRGTSDARVLPEFKFWWTKTSRIQPSAAPNDALIPSPVVEMRHELDREFYDSLGPERTGTKCRHEGCQRGTIKFSVFCRLHHFEQVKRKPCPFQH